MNPTNRHQRGDETIPVNSVDDERIMVADAARREEINQAREICGLPWTAFPPIPADGCIHFYKRDRRDFGFLSNFFVSPIQVDGVEWAHTEAYYQAQKSRNRNYVAKIRENEKPSWSKYVGDSRIGDPSISKKSWFLDRPKDLRHDWDNVKLDVMRTALQAKFTQNANLRKSLLATDDASIIEDSASDFFWGIGRDGSGKNWLGVLLMECREQLQSS